MGFAKGTTLTRFIVRRIKLVNTLYVLRQVAKRLLACMTKATMPGLITANVEVDVPVQKNLQSQIIEIARRIVWCLKDLSTLDANRRA